MPRSVHSASYTVQVCRLVGCSVTPVRLGEIGNVSEHAGSKETQVRATSISDTNTAASTSRGWVDREGRGIACRTPLSIGQGGPGRTLVPTPGPPWMGCSIPAAANSPRPSLNPSIPSPCLSKSRIPTASSQRCSGTCPTPIPPAPEAPSEPVRAAWMWMWIVPSYRTQARRGRQSSNHHASRHLLLLPDRSIDHRTFDSARECNPSQARPRKFECNRLARQLEIN